MRQLRKPHCHTDGVWVTWSQEKGGQSGEARDKETEYRAHKVTQPSTKDTTCTNNPVFLLEMPCVHRGGFLMKPEAGQALKYPHLVVPEAAPGCSASLPAGCSSSRAAA